MKKFDVISILTLLVCIGLMIRGFVLDWKVALIMFIGAWLDKIVSARLKRYK